MSTKILKLENLSRHEVAFLVNHYDAFDYNFDKGFCSVEIDQDEDPDYIERVILRTPVHEQIQ